MPEAATAWGTSVQLALCPTSSSSLQFQHVGSSIFSSHIGEKTGRETELYVFLIPSLVGPPYLFAFGPREMRDSNTTTSIILVRSDPRAQRDKLRLFGNHDQAYGAIYG